MGKRKREMVSGYPVNQKVSDFPGLRLESLDYALPERSTISRGMHQEEVKRYIQEKNTRQPAASITIHKTPEHPVNATKHILTSPYPSSFISGSSLLEAPLFKYAPKKVEGNRFIATSPTPASGVSKYASKSYLVKSKLNPNESRKGMAWTIPGDLVGNRAVPAYTKEGRQKLEMPMPSRASSYAITDKEILMNLEGKDIKHSEIMAYHKVKQIDKEKYEQFKNRQTYTKGVGVLKAKGKYSEKQKTEKEAGKPIESKYRTPHQPEYFKYQLKQNPAFNGKNRVLYSHNKERLKKHDEKSISSVSSVEN